VNIPKRSLELPPEAEPVRDFFEALDARYESQIEELKQQVQLLSEQVQSLTKRLQKPNPQNSSLPPSSEHPHGKPSRKPSKRRIRKQGGQEGHKRHLRELVPIEQCEVDT
jgi:transposase